MKKKMPMMKGMPKSGHEHAFHGTNVSHAGQMNSPMPPAGMPGSPMAQGAPIPQGPQPPMGSPMPMGQ